MKNAIIVYLLLISFTFLGCKSRPNISDFTIGMEEELWKKKAENLEYGDWKYNYELNIDNNKIPVHVAFNDDGINSGALRIITYGFCSEESIDTSLQMKNIRQSLSDGEESDFDDFRYLSSICSAKRFDNVFLFLTDNFGKPDSIKYKIESTDTLLHKFYFNSNNRYYVLTRSNRMSPNKYVREDYFEDVNLFEISNNFQNELSAEIAIKRESITAPEIVKMSVYVSPLKYDQNYNSNAKGFTLIVMQDDPVRQYNGMIFEKSLKSVKGYLVVKDNHGDSIFSHPNYKFTFEYPLISPTTPGITYAMKEQDYSYVIMETKRPVFISVDHPLSPPALVKAYKNEDKISAEFVVESVLFTDGTIVK